MNAAQDDFPALQAAARAGDPARVKALLYSGVDQNTHPGMPHGFSPLMHAANRGHLEVVKLLVAQGARVNFEDGDGFTAITLAAARRTWKIVKVLAAAGGDVNHMDASGMSAMRAAVKWGDPRRIAFLRGFERKNTTFQ